MHLYKYNPHTLSMEPVRQRKWPNLKWLFVLLICMMGLGFGSAVKVNTVIERIPMLIEHTEEACTKENVQAYLLKIHVKYPVIVWQQIYNESDSFNSPIFKGLNNLTGMEFTTGRPTLGINVGQRFARFNSWKECIADYAIWQSYMTHAIRDSVEYYRFLDRVYCPHQLEENKGELYSTRLKKIQW